jgi:nitroreductase
VHAPNHHDTQPWRFFVLTSEARSDFGEVLAQALKRRLGEPHPRPLHRSAIRQATVDGEGSSEAGPQDDALRQGQDEAVLEAQMRGERAKPMRSPVLIVVGVVCDDEDAMARREDLQAASAALQNMLIAANALGMAAIWRTGDGAYDDGVKAWFGLRPQDEIAGILYLGYADETLGPMPGRVREWASKTEWRGG